MNYRLSYQNETYPVEDLHLPRESTLEHEPVGQPFSFVSPVRLTIGQCCLLLGESVGYHLRVHSCSGFMCSVRYLVSGVTTTKEAAEAVTVRKL